MTTVDCHELTVDEQLALAGALSDGLAGRAFALVKDESIVFDTLDRPEPAESEVEALVGKFLSRRKDAEHYSVERVGHALVVRSADPLARSRGRKDTGQNLPPNLLKCPYSGCGFVTPYQELYTVHVRSHGF